MAANICCSLVAYVGYELVAKCDSDDGYIWEHKVAPKVTLDISMIRLCYG
jgi:hypothetical protein